MIEQLTKDLIQQIQSTSENLKGAKTETEAHLRSMLERALSKLNLVTREEFDTQNAILQRTREKLEKLEAQLDALSEKKDADTDKITP